MSFYLSSKLHRLVFNEYPRLRSIVHTQWSDYRVTDVILAKIAGCTLLKACEDKLESFIMVVFNSYTSSNVSHP